MEFSQFWVLTSLGVSKHGFWQCFHIGKNAVSLQNSWLSDFGRFPVTSSSMTVKSKCVLHTKLVVLASIESVLSEKWAFQGHFAALQRLSHRQKRCFATKQLPGRAARSAKHAARSAQHAARSAQLVRAAQRLACEGERPSEARVRAAHPKGVYDCPCGSTDLLLYYMNVCRRGGGPKNIRIFLLPFARTF